MGAVLDVSSSNGSTSLTRRGNHYIMSHFSAFIDRGYQRVDVQDDLNTKFAAFKSPDESKLIVIAVNPTKNSESLSIDLGGKDILGSKVYLSTEDAENSFKNKYLQDLGEYHNGLEIPGRSLTTIEINLAPKADYVPEETIKKENPYVKSSTNGINSAILIALAAAAATIGAAAGIVVVVKKRRKNKAASGADT